MKMQIVGSKGTGIVIIAMAVVIGALMLSITDQLGQSAQLSCQCEEGLCPMTGNLPVQSYIGFSMIGALVIFGSFIIFRSRHDDLASSRRKADMARNIKSLEKDEQALYQKIAESDGVVFQGDLVEQLGFSKVKVSRMLDRMEHRGLLEKRRRGMSNIIILKR